MEDPMETTPATEPLNLDAIRSQIKELTDTHRSCKEDVMEMASSDSEELLKECALQLESKVREIVLEYSDVGFLGIEDLEAYVEHLKEELQSVQDESFKVSSEIETLTRTHFECFNQLESDLEELNCSLDFIASQGLEKVEENPCFDCTTCGGEDINLMNAYEDPKFEILELESQIEKRKMVLGSLDDLDTIFKRLDAIEQIEDSFAGLKVIEFEGSCIRISMRTYIPKIDGLLCQHKVEDISVPSELDHELLIEITNGTMELKNVEVFPDDIYITDIVDAEKSYRQLLSQLPVLETRSSLEWFIGKVQDRIILSTLRQFAVKCVNKSRHSVEYLDRDEMVVAHLVGGVDAFIKLSQGWPLLHNKLELISMKSSKNHSNEISLSFLCKVVLVANSLDVHIRRNLLNFVDAVEKVLVEQMRLEINFDDTLEK